MEGNETIKAGSKQRSVFETLRRDLLSGRYASGKFPSERINLHRLTRERKYLETAKALYVWGRRTFFDEGSGAVYDHIKTDGTLVRWDFSYNTGTFLGSAFRLHRATGERRYMDDALKAGEHMVTALSPNGVLKSCGQGDGGAFNGIGARYLAELAVQREGRGFAKWIFNNAGKAWENRRLSDGISGADWARTPAEDVDVEGQTANAAVTLMLVAEKLKRISCCARVLSQQHLLARRAQAGDGICRQVQARREQEEMSGCFTRC